MKKRLTEMTKTSGCAAKIGPGILAEVITNLPKMNSDKLLVGIENSDDAAVYKLTEDIATMQTLDFFTPMDILSDILRGGADKVIEAGAIIAGGHSIQDDEPKYGLSVTGIVNPKKH
jgi:selenide,water dikinase